MGIADKHKKDNPGHEIAVVFFSSVYIPCLHMKRTTEDESLGRRTSRWGDSTTYGSELAMY